MIKKKRGSVKKYIDVTHTIIFSPKQKIINTYEHYIPSFQYLYNKVGKDPLNIVMEYMNFNTTDTRKCLGFQCPERLYKSSKNHYCRNCYIEQIKDGVEWCKECKCPIKTCYHCKKCKQIKCYCIFPNDCIYCELSPELCTC